MNFFYSPPRYQRGNSFSSFLKEFESFCDSVKASDAAKKHAFLQSLPEDMRFSMTDGRKELYELSYDELIQKANNTASGLSSQKHAMQQLFQRTQGFDESVRNFLEAIAQLGKMAYPNDEQHEMRSSVLYNLLVRGLRDRQQASQILRDNSKNVQPDFYATAKNIIENAERTHHEPRIMTSEVAAVTGDHQDVYQLKKTVEKLQDELFQLRKEMKTAREPREERRRLQCFNCGEYGHIARRCHRQRARNFRRASDIHGTHSNPPREIYQVQTMDQDLHREQVFQR
ncbi:unnamed protein product [Clavelina lepadiformis]|uniref:CCHC-type domain-containing protein n=1 Tax=Clavelina lepadiformis TaxID=159417 RepID=A0ABP0H2F0_CLALP